MNSCIRVAAVCGLLFCVCAHGASKEEPVEHAKHQVAEPINPSSRNPFTQIRNIIFPDQIFEFAIMGTGHSGYIYDMVVVIRSGDDYRCEDRTLNIMGAVDPDGKINAAKLATLKVVSRSKLADPKIIGMLKRELESQVACAAYLPRQSPVIPCDGYSYEVYCGNEAANIWPSPQPTLTSPQLISNALVQINASDNPVDHLSWNQIRTFLEARDAGKNPSPFVPQPPPVRIEGSDLPPP